MGTFPDLRNKRVELAAMAHQIAKDRGISYVEALLALGREQPGLITDAYESVLGRIVRETTCGWPGHQVTITDIGTRLSEMARERSEKKNIPFAAALSEIGHEFPTLAQAHRLQVLGKKRAKAVATAKGEAR